MSEAKCELCGEPMPEGEEMFKFHGYSGPCPKPPLQRPNQQHELLANFARECFGNFFTRGKWASEQEWLTSTDPQAMLEVFHSRRAAGGFGQRAQFQASDRKLRLFACACCRQVWDSFVDPHAVQAVEWGEKIADGLLPSGEKIYSEMEICFTGPGPMRGSFEAELALRCLDHIERLTENAGLPRWFSVSTKHAAQQAALLRDIVGNPFRPVKRTQLHALPGHERCDEACGTHEVPCDWLTPTVLSLAAGIYEERAFDRMPILGDALEESGCVESQILDHCRGPGPHVRGCWVEDLILGKE